MSEEIKQGEIVDEETFSGDATSALMALNASEIDTQIKTAKNFPRSIKEFIREATEMVTLTEEIAGECMYAIKRGRKTLEGPSARFAEILVSAWGNCRAGTRCVEEADRFVTSQGVFIDLQRNTAISCEVKRRITDSNGNRYSDDMVGVTTNAANSIALRNAILKGIPKAFWRSLYNAARHTAIGDVTTLKERRQSMIDAFAQIGVAPALVFEKFAIKGIEDITLDHLAVLRGMYTAIKEGESTIEQAFTDEAPETRSKLKVSKVNQKLGKRQDAADKA